MAWDQENAMIKINIIELGMGKIGKGHDIS
jgi:hypothetical protein